MGQDFGGKCLGRGGGRDELLSHVTRELVVEGIRIVDEGEVDGLEQVS